MWDITYVGFASVAALSIWVAIEFYRNHRSFKARERLYLSISQRIQSGEQVASHEYEELLPEDQAALQALKQSKQTLLASRPLRPTPKNQNRGEVVAHANVPLESQTAEMEHRG